MLPHCRAVSGSALQQTHLGACLADHPCLSSDSVLHCYLIDQRQVVRCSRRTLALAQLLPLVLEAGQLPLHLVQPGLGLAGLLLHPARVGCRLLQVLLNLSRGVLFGGYAEHCYA